MSFSDVSLLVRRRFSSSLSFSWSCSSSSSSIFLRLLLLLLYQQYRSVSTIDNDRFISNASQIEIRSKFHQEKKTQKRFRKIFHQQSWRQWFVTKWVENVSLFSFNREKNVQTLKERNSIICNSTSFDNYRLLFLSTRNRFPPLLGFFFARKTVRHFCFAAFYLSNFKDKRIKRRKYSRLCQRFQRMTSVKICPLIQVPINFFGFLLFSC